MMLGKINTFDKHKKWQGKTKWVLAAVLVLVLVAAAAIFISHRHNHAKQVAVHIPSKGPAKSSTVKKSAKAAAAANGNSVVSDKSAGHSTNLVAPSGTFVSNHRPSLSGSPLLKSEESVCNTTPGASCYILFMKDGIAKQLDPQTADASGSTSWSWDIGQAGLTEGSWKITAVATLNGQTLSSDDSLTLDVQP